MRQLLSARSLVVTPGRAHAIVIICGYTDASRAVNVRTQLRAHEFFCLTYSTTSDNEGAASAAI